MSYKEINDSVKRFFLEIGKRDDSDGAMGRPPLNMKPTTVRLSAGSLRRIEALVGNRRIAAFIREAVEQELERRENSGKDR